MNLLDILRSRSANLPEGEYTLGINAVVQHIDVATKHLLRGQETTDETAFTDAIYRTNQAFEGSLKEAYRVLAGKDPAHETPNNIESYLQQQNLLRPRVLAQFTNYRREWRNPSTHDYRLDFDEDEALLAIVTVAAFAIVLIDQITERIAFERAKAATPPPAAAAPTAQPLIEQLFHLSEQFVPTFNKAHSDRTDIRETEITGAFAGFLTTSLPDLITQMEGKLLPDHNERADLFLTLGQERVLIEMKRARFAGCIGLQNGLQQVSHYMALSGVIEAILFVFVFPNDGSVSRNEYPAIGTNGRIVVISTNAKPA